MAETAINYTCSCDGCWACSGHEADCSCDVDWDALAEERIDQQADNSGRNLDSDLPNPSLGGRGSPGGDPVRSGGVAGSIPASAAPPSGSPNGSSGADG